MEDQKNLELKDVILLTQMFPVEPLFNKVIVTLNKEQMDGNLVLTDNTVCDEQYIMAKGSGVHNLNVNDKVILDLEKMMVKHQSRDNVYEEVGSIKFDPILIDGIFYAILEDRFIKARYLNNQPLQTNE
jgi:hypothetical protein